MINTAKVWRKLNNRNMYLTYRTLNSLSCRVLDFLSYIMLIRPHQAYSHSIHILNSLHANTYPMLWANNGLESSSRIPHILVGPQMFSGFPLWHSLSFCWKKVKWNLVKIFHWIISRIWLRYGRIAKSLFYRIKDMLRTHVP